MKEVDLFWLCWNIGVNALWDGSNSHKILEYLSTGRPIVSHYVSSYRNTDLLYMMPTNENESYPRFFKKIISLICQGEPEDIIKKRVQMAVESSYIKKIHTIEELINNG